VKYPEEMNAEEIRSELLQMRVTPRFLLLIVRELSAVETHLRASAHHADERTADEIVEAQQDVLRAYGMATRRGSLNRKGCLFMALASIERKSERCDLA
jgi:hypothetical protein